jgi:hypothetical protein
MKMHAERVDSNQFARASLSGTIQNGHLDASGFFVSGRTMSLNWQRNCASGRVHRQGAGRATG